MYMLDYYFFFISIFLLKPQGNPKVTPQNWYFELVMRLILSLRLDLVKFKVHYSSARVYFVKIEF